MSVIKKICKNRNQPLLSQVVNTTMGEFPGLKCPFSIEKYKFGTNCYSFTEEHSTSLIVVWIYLVYLNVRQFNSEKVYQVIINVVHLRHQELTFSLKTLNTEAIKLWINKNTSSKLIAAKCLYCPRQNVLAHINCKFVCSSSVVTFLSWFWNFMCGTK